MVLAPSVAEHDVALEAVTKQLAECGLTLHKEKCLLNQSKNAFYGCFFRLMEHQCTHAEFDFWNNSQHQNQRLKLLR